MDRSSLPSSLFASALWGEKSNPIWPLSTLLLRRNLEQFSFPPKLDKGRRQQVLALLSAAVMRATQWEKPLFLPAETLSALDKEYLYEHFFCRQTFQNALEGEGVIIDSRSDLLALLNIEEHLQLQLVETRGDLQNAWKRLLGLEEEVGRALRYAYSERFGYLCSSLESVGTGLQTSAFLHLPALIHTKQLEEVLHKQRTEEVAVSGMLGTKEDYVGDYLLLSNRYSLGIDEEKILSRVYATAIQMVEAEKQARAGLKRAGDPRMKDLVSRACGLLLHSYQLQTKEALSSLSLIKLGVALGWVGSLSDGRINTIALQCRRAHLAHAIQLPDASPEELAKKRAEYLHRELKQASERWGS